MKTRAIGMLCVAALLGAVAVFVARGSIDSHVLAPVVIATDRVPLANVVVARRDRFLGDRLEASNHGQPHQSMRLMPRG